MLTLVVYNIHFTFEKVHKKFTVFHKRNITSSQVTHLKNYLGWQNNRRATEEENGWNPPVIKFLPPHLRTPSPKRMPGAHAQHQWTLGAHQTPSPNRPVRATPSPNPPPPYIKGLLIGHNPSFSREPLWTSLHPLSQVKVKWSEFTSAK